jgi:D-alanine-D-alanine ligase
MHVAILVNQDADALQDDPGREARADVRNVAEAMSAALASQANVTFECIEVEGAALRAHQALTVRRPDVVLNLCESVAGDARGEMLVPTLLEALSLPYSGSDALALGVALHKGTAKALLSAAGVPTPEWVTVQSEIDIGNLDLPFPVIVKPSREDASVGIDARSVVSEHSALVEAVSRVLNEFRQPAIVERFVDGREVYVPLLGNANRRALPLTQIQFGPVFAEQPKILSYRAKWDVESQEYQQTSSAAAMLEVSVQQRCVDIAKAAFECLGCRDYGRVDLRLDAHGNPYVIEVNPNCDLHPQAGFAKAAALGGLSYPDLAMQLLSLALERHHAHQSHSERRPSAAQRAAEANRNLHPRRGQLRNRADRNRTEAKQP